MSVDVLERLRHENPVPGVMPALPIEPVLARLDPEPPAGEQRSLRGSRRARRALPALPAIASLAVVVAVVAGVLSVGRRTHPTSASSSPTTPTKPVLPKRVVPGAVDLPRIARENVRDTPLELFQRNPAVVGPASASQPPETVIASTVRELGTFTVSGVGRIQYWVADTRQKGVCGALRLPDGEWAGLGDGGHDGGQFPACYATRAQTGAGVLIIDGFDYLQTTLPSHNGQRWYILYGAVSGNRAPARVLDTFSNRSASLVRDHYFAIALHPVGNDWGDDVHLVAFDAAGRRIATQGKPLPGTLTEKCIGRYDVRRVPIPGTHRTTLEWRCRRYVKVLAK